MSVDTTHLAGAHHRPLVVGHAAALVGTDPQLRQVGMLVGAYTDECESCQSDMLDAVSLSGDLMAVLHRVFKMVTEGVLVPQDSDLGIACTRAQWETPFALRRTGAAKQAAAISAWLTKPRHGFM